MAMRPDQQKRADRFRHFTQRLYHRYGIKLTKGLKAELLDKIQGDRDVEVMWGSSKNHTLAYTVASSVGNVAVVYDYVSQELVTALPPGAVRQ